MFYVQKFFIFFKLFVSDLREDKNITIHHTFMEPKMHLPKFKNLIILIMI